MLVLYYIRKGKRHIEDMNSLNAFLKKIKDHFIPGSRNVYRPHVLRRAWLIFFLAVVFTAEGVFIADVLTRQSAFSFLASVLSSEVVALTNDERAGNSIPGVRENAELDAAAQAKAEDMAQKGYFAHVGPDGKEPWAWVAEAGYKYRTAGENLAVRFTDSREVVEAWMDSPSHRANILKPVYTEIGVGVAQGTFRGEPATYVVQYFAAPLSEEPAVETPPIQTPSSEAVAVAQSSSTTQVQGATTDEPAKPAVPPDETIVEETPTPPAAVSSRADSPWSSFARELVRGEVRPTVAVLWVLGGVASLLIAALALAFFVHIQVQPTDMLVSGAVVAAVAVSFLALNLNIPYAAGGDPSQTAAVFGAMPHSGGFIDSNAASR